MGNHHKNEDVGGVTPGALIGWALYLGAIYLILSTASTALNLTGDDVKMIPVGAVFFLTLWFLLARGVFEPYIQLNEKREAATIGADGQAGAKEAQAAELRAKYEDSLTQCRVTAMKSKIAELNTARSQAQEIIEKAEHSAAQQIQQARADLQSRIGTLRGELEREADQMVNQVVDQIKQGGQLTA